MFTSNLICMQSASTLSIIRLFDVVTFLNFYFKFEKFEKLQAKEKIKFDK